MVLEVDPEVSKTRVHEASIPKVDPKADNTRVQSKTSPEVGCTESSGDGVGPEVGHEVDSGKRTQEAVHDTIDGLKSCHRPCGAGTWARWRRIRWR